MAAAFEATAFEATAFEVAGSGSTNVLSPSPDPVATSRGSRKLAGYLDMVLDPITRDYIDTANGEWLETADSRTMVFAMLEQELNGDMSAPEDGTRIAALIRTGEPVTDTEVIDEATRALQLLIADGSIADLSVSPTTDETGRFALVLFWTDGATGLPVDLIYSL